MRIHQLALLVTDPRRVMRALARRVASSTEMAPPVVVPGDSVAGYWTRHNVTSHASFADAESSLDYFWWRNDQYVGYIELMPVAVPEGQVILDYGCGPGNDLVGFAAYAKPARLIGMDLSRTSLDEAGRRLALHNRKAELTLIEEGESRIPLEDASVDYVHSSGVLHHVPDPARVLRELHRVLKPGGEARIMVYNYDSVWLHLRAAYRLQIEEPRFPDLPLLEVFKRSTDGEHCPISRAWKPAEVCELAARAGFTPTFLGAAISLTELEDLRLKRWEAVASPKLAREHRQFLSELTLDVRGIPLHGAVVAGVDACFSLRKMR